MAVIIGALGVVSYDLRRWPDRVCVNVHIYVLQKGAPCSNCQHSAKDSKVVGNLRESSSIFLPAPRPTSQKSCLQDGLRAAT